MGGSVGINVTTTCLKPSSGIAETVELDDEGVVVVVHVLRLGLQKHGQTRTDGRR